MQEALCEPRPKDGTRPGPIRLPILIPYPETGLISNFNPANTGAAAKTAPMQMGPRASQRLDT
jgi:hypothetical protein